MTIRVANNHVPGVHTFYVSSERNPAVNYTVQHVRRCGQRRYFCDCKDFTYRRVMRKRHCKHCRAVAQLAKAAHGVSKLPAAIAAFTYEKPFQSTEMETRGAA